MPHSFGTVGVCMICRFFSNICWPLTAECFKLYRFFLFTVPSIYYRKRKSIAEKIFNHFFHIRSANTTALSSVSVSAFHATINCTFAPQKEKPFEVSPLIVSMQPCESFAIRRLTPSVTAVRQIPSNPSGIPLWSLKMIGFLPLKKLNTTSLRVSRHFRRSYRKIFHG